MGRLRGVSSNQLSISNRLVKCRRQKNGLCRVHSGRITTRHQSVNVIFRHFGLFPRVATTRGIVTNPIIIHNSGGGGTQRQTVSLLNRINLNSHNSDCPVRLSNKRRRQITVTQTLTVSPSLVLFSRPASTLSPRLINRILSIVHGLTDSNVAVIIIARRVKFTQRTKSVLTFVSTNIITRVNRPQRLLTGPRAGHFRSFLNGIL